VILNESVHAARSENVNIYEQIFSAEEQFLSVFVRVGIVAKSAC
jgi:hypothetical protein